MKTGDRTRSDSIRAFKAGVTGLKRRKRFIECRKFRAFAAELRAMLARLGDYIDPCTGVAEAGTDWRPQMTSCYSRKLAGRRRQPGRAVGGQSALV